MHNDFAIEAEDIWKRKSIRNRRQLKQSRDQDGAPWNLVLTPAGPRVSRVTEVVRPPGIFNPYFSQIIGWTISKTMQILIRCWGYSASD